METQNSKLIEKINKTYDLKKNDTKLNKNDCLIPNSNFSNVETNICTETNDKLFTDKDRFNDEELNFTFLSSKTLNEEKIDKLESCKLNPILINI